ncbi:U-box domain-containing protein 13-like isoform X2 [Camellia sinensis]|uniref:U-box domain-containing protein 13-like isoform X2 n=1 Tax=Camellia sinensis TaxID=4442 RepID=UPI001036C23B|nr:U-box domain-containing protein 13-like isoform X2 [Camellia sinensis]
MAMEEESAEQLLKKLIDIVNEISSISGFRCVVRRQCRDLSRRLKLLMPLFEEIRDQISQETLNDLISLKEALESAKELLGICSRGSNILLVLQSEKIRSKFKELAVQFEQALRFVSYDKLDIPDELKEQVELVHSQFAKAKERIEEPDLQLYEHLFSIYNQSSDADIEPGLTRTLCEKLELMTIEQLKEESLALDEMVMSCGWDVVQTREKMLMVMKKFEDCVRAEHPNISIPVCENWSGSDQTHTIQSPKSPFVPDDFRCPISLELMKDPVIICTGQTYERACIKKWLEAGHGTCPKTQQKLFSTTLTHNYVLSSIITRWCEDNGVEPPTRLGNSRLGELRLLAKNNGNNRMFIAQAGAIPLLVGLLSTPDTTTQEHVITSLLNLSICEDNKRGIVSSEAVPGILHVLKHGSMEARENAAATIFSLTVLDEFKVTIGSSGAIPTLVTLLKEGSPRGKKDAAAALFNLCIFQGNKVRAIRAGLVPLLMTLLIEPGSEMVEEALAIVAMLASHSEGKGAIGSFKAVPLFVDLVRNGSPKSKENATAVLVHLCAGDQQYLSEARTLGVVDPLLDLAENGTDRCKRKAAQLLQLLLDPTEPVGEAQVQTGGPSDTQTRSILLPVTAGVDDS